MCSIVIAREPIYRQVEIVPGFAHAMYGLGEQDLGHLGDDRLYDADRVALLTAVVLAVGKCFGVKFEELHNDYFPFPTTSRSFMLHTKNTGLFFTCGT